MQSKQSGWVRVLDSQATAVGGLRAIALMHQLVALYPLNCRGSQEGTHCSAGMAVAAPANTSDRARQASMFCLGPEQVSTSYPARVNKFCPVSWLANTFCLAPQLVNMFCPVLQRANRFYLEHSHWLMLEADSYSAPVDEQPLLWMGPTAHCWMQSQ